LNHTDTSRHRHNDRRDQSSTTAAFARTPVRSRERKTSLKFWNWRGVRETANPKEWAL
jgi:hypothetical protein